MKKANAADFRDSSREGASEVTEIGGEPLFCETCDRTCERFVDAALRGEAVSVGYGDRVIIEPMDVAVPAGEITSIIGPNGCGKSTLLKALSRTMPLHGGAVYLNGTAIATMPTAEVARQMALLPQSPQAPAGLTVGELVALGRYPHQRGFGRPTDDDRRIIDWALSITHLDGLAERPIDALSGGQRQRAWIAMALAQDTGLILLDEPTTYLDIGCQLETWQLCRDLAAQGRTVVAVSHDIGQSLRYGHRVLLVEQGRLRMDAGPQEAAASGELERVFGVRIRPVDEDYLIIAP